MDGKRPSSAGHPNHRLDSSKPLDATEAACLCGIVGPIDRVAAHIGRCAEWWDKRQKGS